MWLSLVSSADSRERWSEDDGGPRRYFPGSRGAWGMALLIASLGMVFGAILVMALWLRAQYPVWPPPELPRPPVAGLIAATLLLAGVSMSLYSAARAMRRLRFSAVRVALAIALLLSLSFLAMQASNWSHVLGSIETIAGSRPAMFLCFFCVLHAAHVLGGVGFLTVLALRAARYRLVLHNAAPLRYCAAYWNFLDVVWIAVLAALLIPGGR